LQKISTLSIFEFKPSKIPVTVGLAVFLTVTTEDLVRYFGII